MIINHSLACLSLVPSIFSLIFPPFGPSTPNRQPGAGWSLFVTTQIFVIHFLLIKVPNFGAKIKLFIYYCMYACIPYYMYFMILCVLQFVV
jgi:hypothetical protein